MTLVALERDCERIEALRTAFLAYQAGLAPERVFFIDETGSTVAMARTHGRAPRGQPVEGRVPRNYGHVITIIGALTTEGLKAVMTVRGGTDKLVFRAYVEHVLLPELREGDVVVLDNLAAHKDVEVKQLIEQRGAKLIFQPPYSPDLNRIELAWAWLKNWLRLAQARSEQAVNTAIRWGMDLITPEMAQGWIRHCGYRAQAR